MGQTTQTSYSIRQVVELTGVSEYTIRAWELRYDAFKPERTETGRRRYDNEDLLKARTLFELTQQNHKIGDIAHLSPADLKKILASPVTQKKKPEEIPECRFIASVMHFTQLFRWEDVQQIFIKRRVALGTIHYISDFILPLLQALNKQIAFNRISIAQEHILSAFIKESLHALSSIPMKKQNQKRLLLAGIEGDFHEIGLLVALVLAKNAGFQTLFLGANVPKRDLCETSVRYRATHILLSSTVSKNEGAKEDFLEYLHFMDHNLPKKTEFWFGGRNVTENRFELKRKNNTLLNFDDLQNQLKKNSS